LASQQLAAARRRRLRRLSKERAATVITLIHRQETMSLFGFTIVRFVPGPGEKPSLPPPRRPRRQE
jgi:hypothetical protein